MKRILAIFMICCAAALILSPAALAAPEEEPGFDGYLIRMDDAPGEDDTPDGCEEIVDGLYLAETAEDALALAELGSVEYCEPNYTLTIQDNYDDYEPAQWNLRSVGAEAGWAHRDASGSRDRLGDGVTVAIVDSGVMATHPDLQSAHILSTVALSAASNGLDNYHGTFIAGLLAAEVNNGIGVDGIVPNVTILPICITESGGNTNVTKAVLGIHTAVDMGADVISFSIGGTNDSAPLREACQYAADHGVIFVTSAGNYRSGVTKSPTKYMYPPAYDTVVSVSACRQTEDGVEFDSSYSYFNDAVDVSAPGTSVVSLYLDGRTATKSGTSYAAPIVTAMAVMARQAFPGIDLQGFMALLEQSSVDLGDEGFDVYYGHGYVNIPAFLQALDETAIPSAQAASATLTLTGEIGVNYYVVPDETLSGDEGAYACFTYQGTEGEPMPLCQAQTDVRDGVTRYIFTKYVPAKEMAEGITFRLYDGSGAQAALTDSSGRLLPGGKADYSVAHYVSAVASPEGQALAEKLANYGARAMDYFGYAAQTPDAAYADAIVPVEIAASADELIGCKPTRTGSVSGLTVRGVSLTLEALTTLSLSFSIQTGHEIGEYAFTVDGVPAEPEYHDPEGRYYLRIPDIAAKELDTVHTVTVTDGTRVMTLTCCGLSYAYNTLKYYGSAAGKTALRDLALALYAYNQAADAYFGG